MISTEPLRIAVPKGRLQDDVLAAFAAADCRIPSAADLQSRKLVFVIDDIEWIFVKDCDVPVYVEHGAADAGVAGLDQIVEHQSTAFALLDFPFGGCRMSLIAKGEAPPLGERSTVATKYPRIARRFLDDRGSHAEIVPLGGSVELAAVLDLTTHVIDLVQTGETIRVHGLCEVEHVMDIKAQLIVGRDSYRKHLQRIRDLSRRIEESLHVNV